MEGPRKKDVIEDVFFCRLEKGPLLGEDDEEMWLRESLKDHVKIPR